MLFRWALRVQSNNIQLEYQKGKSTADCLSRSIAVFQSDLGNEELAGCWFAREQFIQQEHDNPSVGFEKIVAAIKQRYFWPKMNEQICKFCRECLPCQTSKAGNVNDLRTIRRTRDHPHGQWVSVYSSLVVNHPEVNTERVNKVITTAIRAALKKEHNHWAGNIQVVHNSTKYSSYFINKAVVKNGIGVKRDKRR